MSKLKIAIIAFAIVVLAVVAYGLVGGNDQSVLGGVTNFDALTLDNGNLTISRGNITVSNTSTSTLAIGNITTYATSTATAICLVPSAAGATSTFAGTVYWKYGACPF